MVSIVISLSLGLIFGAVITYALVKKRTVTEGKKQKENADKMYEFYKLLLKWVNNYQNGNSISQKLKEEGIRTVAIYGMKELGECLYDDLKNTDIEVKYFIDRDADYIFAEKKIVKPTDDLEDVDAVIVTAVHYYAGIKKELSSKMNSKIISLSDIIFSVG